MTVARSGDDRHDRMRAQEGLARIMAGDVAIGWDSQWPYTDLERRSIHLPVPPERVRGDDLTKLRAFIDHECGHLRFTAPNCMEGLGPFERALTNAIEDGRINRLVGAEFAGCRANISACYAILRKEIPMEGSDTAHVIGRASMALVLLAEGRSWDEALAYIGGGAAESSLLRSVGDVIARFTSLQRTEDSRACAVEIHARWAKELKGMPPDQPEKPIMASPFGPPGDGRRPPAPVEVMARPERRRIRGPAALAESLIRALEGRRAPGGREAADQGPYLARTDGDREVEIARSPNPGTDSLQELAREKVRRLARELLRDLCPLRRRWDRRKHRGSAVDPRELYRVGVGDPRVMEKRLRDRTDTAIAFLVDFSGSMAGPKIRLALQLAMALSESLDLIGIHNEVLGFTSANHSESLPGEPGRKYVRTLPLRHLVLKRFAERFAACRHAFANSLHQVELVENYDGESVLWAARRLARRPERRRILVVVSDGQPAGPIGAGFGSGILHRHLKEAIAEVEAKGISAFGIGVKSPAVEKYYRDFVVLDDIDALVTEGYRAISAVLRRRA